MPKAIFYAPVNLAGWSALLLLEVKLHQVLEVDYRKLGINEVNNLIPITAEDEIPIYAGLEVQGFGIVRLVQKALASYELLDPRFSQIKCMENFSD